MRLVIPLALVGTLAACRTSSPPPLLARLLPECNEAVGGILCDDYALAGIEAFLVLAVGLVAVLVTAFTLWRSR